MNKLIGLTTVTDKLVVVGTAHIVQMEPGVTQGQPSTSISLVDGQWVTVWESIEEIVERSNA